MSLGEVNGPALIWIMSRVQDQFLSISMSLQAISYSTFPAKKKERKKEKEKDFITTKIRKHVSH